MRNSKGFSWPETVLSLSIILLIASTLLPLLSNMTVLLEDKKRKYHSSLVVQEATKMYISAGTVSGTMKIDQLDYSFIVQMDDICVHYEGVREEKNTCVSISTY
ncbi:type II secretion system protein [Psychrobacillus sp.]|uniref:type II secretion system protein n=1 Tax=Psychrobacillus sp. TaxID=1871623 RepID=UPI0028BD7E36|nr:type II secretion system protein [Psychrobacillus sp.]